MVLYLTAKQVYNPRKPGVTTAVRLFIELFTFQVRHPTRQQPKFVGICAVQFTPFLNVEKLGHNTHTTHFPSVDKPCSRALISRVRSRPNPLSSIHTAFV